MRIRSVNVGTPREVQYKGESIRTGIFKNASNTPIMLRRLNFDGDGQADLKNHGGVDKAAYAYPFEHYAFWQQQTGREDFSYGQFGENLTIEGLDEAEVFIGDQYRIGDALVEVSQPRLPCFKLGIRMDDPTFPKQLTQAERCGFYLRVIEEGLVKAGDPITRVKSGAGKVSVRRVFHQATHGDDAGALAAAIEVAALPTEWRDWFREKLEKLMV